MRPLRFPLTLSRRLAVVLALQATAVGLLATGALGTSQQSPQSATPQISAAVSVDNDVSAPLADLPAPAAVTPPAPPELERRTPALASPQVRDRAVQLAVPSSNVPATSASFDGLSLASLTSRSLPPDTVGDVGPTQYVQAVNGGFAVFSKTGDNLTGPIDDSSFWSGLTGCQVSVTRGLVDPMLNYDQFADRWVYAVLSYDRPNQPAPFGPSYICIAVSTTGDATGTWNRYSFLSGDSPLGDVMTDYPKLGVWPDGYYLSFNDFDNQWPHDFVGTGAMVLDRAAMLNGTSAQSQFLDLRGVSGLSGGSMLPADADGAAAPPAGSPNYYVEAVDDPTDVNDQLGVWTFHVDWAYPGNSKFENPQALHVSGFNGLGHSVPQPGTSIQLDGLADDRMMNRNQYRNFGAYETLVTNLTVDNGSGGNAPRWFELRNASGWNVTQDSTFAPTALNRWLGSAAMDGAGDIALGYAAGDAATATGLRYTGRLAGDPLNTMQAEATLIAGGGSQTDPANGQRWGDYSQMTVDPSDDCTFWYTGEYYAATANADWHTRIGSFRFPGCVTSSGPTYTVVPAVSGTLREGQTVTTTAGTWSPAPTTTSYQWRRCDSNGVSCYDIPGATASTYVEQPADAGYRLRSKVTVTAGASTSSIISAVTGTVLPLAPVNSVAPSITGTAQVAQTLTAVTGTWSTYAGAPNVFTYQWQRCSPGCAAIPGATNSSYMLAGADAGATIRLNVTATTIGGATSALSAATASVALPPAPTNVVAPRVTGNAQVNQILTAQIGTWTGVAPITYTYQWQTCSAAGTNCTAISAEIGATYRVTSADTGSRLRVTVTASNSGGASSVNTTVTAAVVPLAPTNVVAPALAGTAVVGSALTTSDGTWNGSGPITYAYQWQLCNPGCGDIAGATSNRLDLTSSVAGGSVRVVVTATNGGGSTAVTTGTSAVVTGASSGGTAGGGTTGGTTTGGGTTGGGTTGGGTTGGGTTGGGTTGGTSGGGSTGGGGGGGGGAGSPDLAVSGFASTTSAVPGEDVTFAL
ncbi:MAG: hypothetical protein HOQ28_16635, partial [Thermoleophilia bacterium]|nr:hypothetical protein [Thermoleophilia bacterium]